MKLRRVDALGREISPYLRYVHGDRWEPMMVRWHFNNGASIHAPVDMIDWLTLAGYGEMKLKHPAQYTPAIVDVAIKRLDGVTGTLLDPFAGPGQHLPRLVAPGRKVIGYEIERPWADFGAPLVQCADSTVMPRRTRSIEAIFTSPAYGNRFADHHNARDASTRRSYTHDMRTMLDDASYQLDVNNAGYYAFGTVAYDDLHRTVWAECTRVAAPGCIFLLNASDFIRDRKRVRVTKWHLDVLKELGWVRGWQKRINTPRMRYGANGGARISGETLYELRKP